MTSLNQNLVLRLIRSRDLYYMLDSDLKYKLAYAWSLPPNTRFNERMSGIQDAVNQLSPATEFLNSRVYHLIRQVREAVMYRIELHRLQVEVPVLIQDSAAHTSSCDEAELELELPELVD